MEILKGNLVPYEKFSLALRSQLHDLIQGFLYDHNFKGKEGLEITDEIRVTIAAQACLLLLNRDVRPYPALTTILVYPSTYLDPGHRTFGEDEAPSVRFGESWVGGAVVLSWDSARQGALNFDDGSNVVIHEFAHQLDQEDGVSDGAPILADHEAYATWAAVLSKEFKRLQTRTERGQRSVVDGYGATNPAEFFASASEAFFEKPQQMKRKHPKLFEELRGFYRIDPATWSE